MSKKKIKYLDEDRIAGNGPDAILRSILWASQLRATAPRMKVVEILCSAKHPLSAAEIVKEAGSDCDQATVYRTLDLLVKAEAAVRIHLGEQRERYELRTGHRHHHHIICTSCGEIKDVTSCNGPNMNEDARNGLTKFRLVTGHSLEFYGICRTCEPTRNNL